MRSIIIPVLFAALGVSSASAQDSDNGWSGRGDVALSRNTGSTDFTSAALEHGLRFRGDGFRFELGTSFTYSRTSITFSSREPGEPDEVQTTSFEIYEVDAAVRKDFRTAVYGSLNSAWDRDPSQGIRTRVRALGGLGWRPEGEKMSGRLEASAGVMYEVEVDGDSETFPALGLTFGFDRRFGSGGDLSFESDLVGNLEDTQDVLVASKVSVSASLTERFLLSLHYRVVWDNKPATAVFDPTGTGELTSTPRRTRTSLSASISVVW
ncbi:MAG: hypothetical protein BMS9Abin29_0502 [Gemmatimonadota bacterium]|nr:MAG: hypothetical protein BMS9Abin29_0502 [Gemmatimonadota bacterium]